MSIPLSMSILEEQKEELVMQFRPPPPQVSQSFGSNFMDSMELTAKHY